MQSGYVALLKPGESDFGRLAEFFRDTPFTMEIYADFADLTQSEEVFDVIILPPTLASNEDPLTVLYSLRQTDPLKGPHIIGLMTSRDPEVMRDFYDAGADLVFLPPYAKDHLHFQLTNIISRRNRLKEHFAKVHDQTGLSASSVSALDASNEPLVVFNDKNEPTFANTAAQALFRLTKSFISDEKQRKVLCDALATVIAAAPSERQHTRCRLPRHDGSGFAAEARVLPMLGASEQVAGYALSITDVEEFDQAKRILSEYRKVGGLFLTAGAAALIQSSPKAQGVPLAALRKLEAMIDKSPSSCSLTQVLTALTEVLDLVAAETSRVSIRLDSEYTVAMRYGDLFRIAGHMILFSLTQARSGTELVVGCGPLGEGEEIFLTIAADELCRETISSSNESLLRRLFWSDLTQLYQENILPEHIEAAQRIADHYNTEVQYKVKDGVLKLRVCLPARAVDLAGR